MLQPNQHDVRRFFCAVARKLRQRMPLEPIEAQAAPWVEQHPEYTADLADEASALQAEYPVEGGRSNPFLHLAMHLSIAEQCAIDQPRGVRAAVQQLATSLGTLHAAHHEAMESLGEMIWASQRSGLPPDGPAYVEALRQRASRI